MELLSLTVAEWVALTAIILVSAFAKSVTGFGFALVAAPLLLFLLPTKDVVSFNLIMATWTGILMTAVAWRDVKWKMVIVLSLASFGGIPLGTFILYRVDPATLRILIASVVILFALPMLFGFTTRIRREGVIAPFFGFLSGVLASSTSLSGPPVVLFLVGQGWEKQAMRVTLACFLFVSSLVSLGSQAVAGMLTSRITYTGLMMMPVAFAGYWAGEQVTKRVKSALFRRVAVLLVVASGASAILTEVL
jgi:uncharacterized membrane protein YfcA